MDLPKFTYYRDPYNDGTFRDYPSACHCCGREGSVLHEYLGDEYYCPWCITDGSAELNHNTEFSYDVELKKAGISDDVVFVVTRCTPAYDCFQGCRWLACCHDACEYLGHATPDDLRGLTEKEWQELGFGVDLASFIESFDPSHSELCFYKFQCRHCGTLKYSCDCG